MQRNPIKYSTLIFLKILTTLLTYGQETKEQANALVVQPGWMISKVVPNFKRAPATIPGQGFSLHVGFQSRSNKYSWPDFYHNPYMGIQFIYNKPGNDKVYGSELSMTPYFMFNPLPERLNKTYLKSGLGISYFNNPYNPDINPGNKSIGSHFTWAFELSLYQYLPINQNIDISLGAGYRHASNGHIQLPNLGLNSAFVSLGLKYAANTTFANNTSLNGNQHKTLNRSSIYYRQGVGIHELGSATGPVGGKKNTVYTSAIGWSILLKNHIKIRTGLSYRFYSHYFEQAELREVMNPTQTSVSLASNVYFFLGSEFLIGHVALDIEGGINLYKPYYKTFYKAYEGKTTTLWYKLKSTFPSRLGIKYYLFHTEKNKALNVFAGAHINANFGQADFSECSFGITYSLHP